MSNGNRASVMKREDIGLSLNLAGLFSIRMLGIFLILPIYAQYMREEFNSGGLMTGLFISSYALTQLIMQPIVGALSDKIGRKPAIITGLSLFIAGSLLIAFTSNPTLAIIGRVIQGSGAISSVILALTSDIVREEIRGRVMAVIGIGIGVTFGISVVVSPIIYWLFGGMGIFLACALLGAIAIGVTIKMIPTPAYDQERADAKADSENAEGESREKVKEDWSIQTFLTEFKAAFRLPDVNRLYVGALVLHLMLTGAFTTFSVFLAQQGFDGSGFLKGAWVIYFPSFFISLFIMFAIIGLAERYYRHRPVFLTAIGLLTLSFILFFFNLGYWGLVGAMLLFFIGFNVMEASQPSLMSRLVPEKERGMFMGIFSSAQFIGASIGGMTASLLYSGAKWYFKDPTMGYKLVFAFLVVVLVAWFIYAYPMNNITKPKKKSAEEETNREMSDANVDEKSSDVTETGDHSKLDSSTQ